MKRYIVGTLLVFISLLVTGLYILFLSQEGLRLCVRTADQFLPGKLSVDLAQGRLSDKFSLEGLSYSDGANVVSIELLSLSWRPLSLLHKELAIGSFLIKGASIELEGSANDTDEPAPDTRTLFSSFTLPLSIKIDEGLVDSFTLKTAKDSPAMKVSTFAVNNFTGKENQFQIGNCEVTADSFRIVANGQLQTGDVYLTSLNVDYFVEREGVPPIDGNIVLHGSPDELAFEAHSVSPFKGTFQGVIYDLIGDLLWKGELITDKAALAELGKDWPEIMFTDFQASGEGTLTSYSVQAKTLAAYQSFRDITVSADLHGDASGLKIVDARLNDRDAVLSGTGQLGWENDFTWQAHLTGNHIDPAIFDERWPGRLDLEFSTTGKQSNGDVDAVVDLFQLDGELRDFPLAAIGKIEIDGNKYTIDDLHLQSADSSLQISGQLADSYDLEFTIESPNLITLWPDLSGSIKAEGRIGGSRQQPKYQFDLSGKEISLADTTVSALAASGTGELSTNGFIHASFSATDVKAGEAQFDAIAADVSGTLNTHAFKARVNAPDISARLELEGGYADKKWKGHLTSGAVETEVIQDWQLQQPAPIVLSLDTAEIEKLCLVGEQAALVCLDGTYNQDGNWTAKADLTVLPVDMFGTMLSRIRNFEGSLSGSAHLKGLGAGITEGNLDLATHNLSVDLEFADEYHREIVWEENTLHAALVGSSVEVTINSTLKDGSSITSEAVVSNIETIPFSIENAKVQGKANVNILDLQPLGAITYPTVEPSGALKGYMEFSGALLQPEFSGQIQLDNGTMILPSLGITVNEVEITVDGKDNRILLLATAASGDGRIHAESVYRLFAGEKYQPFEVNITGDNFEIINLQEAIMKVSPNLKVIITKEHGEVDGEILVTEANITLQNIPGTVSPSNDVVFVHAEEEERKTSLPLYADVTIKAGDNVRINAFGLRGRIGGQLQIIDHPTRPVIGKGNLEVQEGTFSIYGRQLQIVRGKLLYSGGPLDNPGIEVRAENTTGGVTTGIQVSGLLREYDVSFYSTPVMEENEIIQRLLTNTSLIGTSEDEGFVDSVTSDTAGISSITSAARSIKEGLRVDDVKIETGEKSDDVSLVIGTWITPKLYVSYGKNLVRESGSFNTRYELGRGFSFVTETAATYNSFDFMYEIDK